MLKNALRYSHELLQEIVGSGDLVVDATMGGGNDTLFLAKLVGKTGKVLAFDIQDLALEQTRERLQQADQLEQVELFLVGHEQVGQYLNHNLTGAIFNLGFLPQSDHQVITKSETTIKALASMLDNLVVNGRIVIVIYDGHRGGLEEKQAILDYLSTINFKQFQVLKYELFGSNDFPPVLVAIERKK